MLKSFKASNKNDIKNIYHIFPSMRDKNDQQCRFEPGDQICLTDLKLKSTTLPSRNVTLLI